MQPLIPIATILEGTLLGALETGYIAKRTGVSLTLSLAMIYASQMALQMGLMGIWVGMATFIVSNICFDTYRLLSPSSPFPIATTASGIDLE